MPFSIKFKANTHNVFACSNYPLLITIILILVRIIQKNQMSPEEHQEIKNAELKEEDNQYVKILDEINSENANKNQDKQQDEHKE